MDAILQLLSPVIASVVATSPVIGLAAVLLLVAVFALLRERAELRKTIAEKDSAVSKAVDQSIRIIDSLHNQTDDYASNLVRLTDSLQRLMSTVIR